MESQQIKSQAVLVVTEFHDKHIEVRTIGTNQNGEAERIVDTMVGLLKSIVEKSNSVEITVDGSGFDCGCDCER